MATFRTIECDPQRENFDLHYFLATILPDLAWIYLGSANPAGGDAGWDIRVRENQLEKLVELEFKSSQYRRDHAASSHPRRADYVVVWQNDDPAIDRDLGVQTLVLSERIQQLPSEYPQLRPQGALWTSHDFIGMRKYRKQALWVLAHVTSELNGGFMYGETLDYLLSGRRGRASQQVSSIRRTHNRATLIMEQTERRGWVALYGGSGKRWRLIAEYHDIVTQALQHDHDVLELRERLLQMKRAARDLDLTGLHPDNQRDIRSFLSDYEAHS